MAVLIVERFSDSGKIVFSIQIAIMSIICFEMLQIDFPNKRILQALYIAFIIANSADPDEVQQTAKLPFQGLSVYKDLLPHFQTISIE